MAGMATAVPLPRIDEHEISVNTSAAVAWAAAVAVFGRTTSTPAWRAFARAIRCQPDHAAGVAETGGATVPGFRVVRSDPPTEWALEGEHLFSHYALTFRVTPVDAERCRIAAQSSAAFPGIHGTVYRALVIGTGGHLIGVRGLLRSMKAAAERTPR